MTSPGRSDARTLIERALESTDDAEIASLARQVASTGDVDAMGDFLSQVRREDSAVFTGAVIEDGNIVEIIGFARHASDDDRQRLAEAVIARGDAHEIERFMFEVDGADVTVLCAVLDALEGA